MKSGNCEYSWPIFCKFTFTTNSSAVNNLHIYKCEHDKTLFITDAVSHTSLPTFQHKFENAEVSRAPSLLIREWPTYIKCYASVSGLRTSSGSGWCSSWRARPRSRTKGSQRCAAPRARAGSASSAGAAWSLCRALTPASTGSTCRPIPRRTFCTRSCCSPSKKPTPSA